MAVHWLEAMARLHGLEDLVLTGFSTRRFQTILDEIAIRRRKRRRGSRAVAAEAGLAGPT